MSHLNESRQPYTLTDLLRKYAAGEKLVMTTAYDAVTVRIAEAAGVDMILVGDSVGNVCLGFENTLPVTMEMMNHHLEAVARTKPSVFLMADMPYLSFHLGVEDTLRNAGGFLRRGAQAVKLEGGSKRLPVIRALVDAEIPVMGHLGLTPQSIHQMGGYRVQGKEGSSAIAILEDAQQLENAGCFALLLEGIPAELAERVTKSVSIPTIGIGAGPGCSGQVLVFHDILGLVPGKEPKFVRKYINGFELLTEAMSKWVKDVQTGGFPTGAESYMLPDAARQAVNALRPDPGHPSRDPEVP